jgi:phosphoribosylformimino-5-aminoimidazole carboxamide ribotide isomerase
MKTFTIFPAIDLRFGQVVRLTQGDPDRQKTYSNDPAAIAVEMLNAGASWLHVVNLDATFGESSEKNILALKSIIKKAEQYQAGVQFGGGLHDLDLIRKTLSYGVNRVVLGSLAAREPASIKTLLREYQPDQIAVSLDGLDKKVMVSGWREATSLDVFELANTLKSFGLRWLVYTDIKRDGMQIGGDFETTISLHKQTNINVIASGGVSSQEEIKILKKNGVAGAIVGRALYEGTLKLTDLLAISGKEME